MLGRLWHDEHSSAVQNVERMKLVALVFSRFGGLVNVAVALVAGHRNYEASPLSYGLAAAITVESIALSVICWRRGWIPAPLIVADTAFSAAGLIVNGLIKNLFFHSWLGFFMYPYTIVTSLMIGVAFRRFWATVAATLVIVGAYLIAAIPLNHDSVANSIPNAVSYLAAMPIAWAVTRAFERSARELDASRAEAELRAAELARERERARHARLLHDRVLQTMEMLARGNWVTDPETHNHLAVEATWLRGLVEGAEADTPGDLVGALHDVVVRKTADGLHVDLNADGLGQPGDRRRRLPAELIEALTGATFEALTNVGKHAKVRTARVHATGDEHGVTVGIADNGIGFDPNAPSDGFGLASSVRARIEEVGGRVDVDSAPGAGTYLEIWLPLPS